MKALYIFIVLFVFLLRSISGVAQFSPDYQKKVDAQIAKLDLSRVTNNFFLNKSFFSDVELDYYRGLKSGARLNPVSSHLWIGMYERLRRAQLVVDSVKFPRSESFVELDRDKVTKSNVLSIGVFNIEGTHLTEHQVLENESKKLKGESLGNIEYEKIRFIGASLLQEDVFQSEVQFKISPSFYFSNSGSEPQTIEINFADGQGFKKFQFRDQMISHKFVSLGKHSIKIRLQIDGELYVFDNEVDVKQLFRRKPFMEFTVAANRVMEDTTSYGSNNASRLANVPGATVRVVLGCDQVYNKPLIIAEGLDLGESESLEDAEAKWTGGGNSVMQAYINEGYDLVFVNYTYSKDFIQNNAEVLKAVIRQVNSTKIGNSDLIVIGTSMSGLVARYALRHMETQAEAHHVSHLICHDSPHQGANVPIGLLQLYWDTPLDIFENLVLFALSPTWSQMYRALPTPAARQLLLHWAGSGNGGIGAKHPDFDALRTALNGLGNQGYPMNCRNLAMINGSMNASDRASFNDFTYGDRIMLGWIPGLRRNVMFDVHTNKLSQNDQVLRVSVFQVFPLQFYTRTRNYNNALNDDFLPGGTQEINNRVIGFLSTKTFRFGFVPSFSSIDYSGPRTTQVQRENLNIGTIQANHSPFAAIYGEPLNSPHATVNSLQWGTGTGLGTIEGLLTGSGCPAVTPPPSPQLSIVNLNCLPFSDYRESHGFDITVNIGGGQQAYRHVITIQKLGSGILEEAYVAGGQTSFTFKVYEKGQYKIRCIRSYANRLDVTSEGEAVFNASDCLPQTSFSTAAISPPNLDCKGFWEGDYLTTNPADTTKHIYAHIEPQSNLLYASVGETTTGQFVTQTDLTAFGVFSEFSTCFSRTDPRSSLPVVLINFEAKSEGHTSLISWRTASEVDTDRFEVERSHNAKDWSFVGNVPAKNGGVAEYSYSFSDGNPGSNLVYYRLRMVDIDKTYAYSGIREVKFKLSDVVVYPNPIQDDKQLNLLLTNQTVDQVLIYDLSGKLIYQKSGPIKSIMTTGLMRGRYLLKIRLQGGSESNHVIVKR